MCLDPMLRSIPIERTAIAKLSFDVNSYIETNKTQLFTMSQSLSGRLGSLSDCDREIFLWCFMS